MAVSASFDEKKSKSEIDFEDMIKIDKKKLESAFNVKINEKDIKNTTTGYMNEISSSITTNIKPAKELFDSNLEKLAKDFLNGYIKNPKKTTTNELMPSMVLPVIYTNDVDNLVKEFLDKEENKKILSDLEKKYVIPAVAKQPTEI